MKRCSTILISEDGERSIKVCTSDSAPILCGCDLKLKPWKRKPFGGHELLDDGNDAGGGGVVQDGDRVHEVWQGAEEPSNPVQGRALPEQFLQMVKWFRVGAQHKVLKKMHISMQKSNQSAISYEFSVLYVTK